MTSVTGADMTAEDIVHLLAVASPVDLEQHQFVCALCEDYLEQPPGLYDGPDLEPFYADLSWHNQECPWRLAVEWAASHISLGA